MCISSPCVRSLNMKKRVLGRANLLAARIQHKEINTTPTSLQLERATLTTKQTNKEQPKNNNNNKAN